MEWMILPLKRYADFRGRSCRKEFWMFFLFTIIVNIVLSLVDVALGLGGHVTSYSASGANGYDAGGSLTNGLLGNLWSLAMFIPSIAVGVRRLHDLDRSGWWYAGPLILMIFGGILFALGARSAIGAAGMGGMFAIGLVLLVIGGIMGIVLFVWFCMHGTVGPNRFGPDPLAPMGDLHETFR